MMAKAKRRRAPAWAVLCTVLGALLMVGSGGTLVAAEVLQARYALEEGNLLPDDPEAEPGADIEGPLNILLVGIDTRPSQPTNLPLADAIVLVHVNETLDAGYFISIARDTLVEIPPFEETGYFGGTDRINAAMSFGAQPQQGEDLPNLERGVKLMAFTVADLTGVSGFDAAAVIQFEGFEGIVDAIGGITITLDDEIYSCHRQPDGTHRAPVRGVTTCPHNYSGPQMHYPAGENDLNGWQALDIVRQRYGLDDGDYSRAGNQQKVMKAIMEQALSRDVVTNPVALDRVLTAAGDNVLFDGQGRQPVEFAFALRDLRPGSIASITLPGEGVSSGGSYQGEQLLPEAYELFDALRAGTMDEFIALHPDLVS